ncbi:MAG: type II toxin-antitoxin system RelE/ParE family toxin [Bacteroidetes bacterium]|nr:type II toxin-antitoxin system RelE/ParE family toxin [Bacteroidota bacterium]MBU1116544.1 type II toxin-antitoxin system RelE/ParE family toxin [Bacteroidota bacterium]MBU1796836.1 type II toxin-antitoxin system RelE/ParE family toxin [Bacteroidota bacterium]
MKVRFLLLAERELEEAIEYYNLQLPSLARQFYTEVSKGIDRIVQYPDAWSKVGNIVRRYLIKQFPYAIYYVNEGNEIVVVSIAHLHRKPDTFNNRIN